MLPISLISAIGLNMTLMDLLSCFKYGKFGYKNMTKNLFCDMYGDKYM